MLRNRNFVPAFKILYIGQAKGNNLTRNAQDRLKSHSTLQKVLADINDSKLIYDIRLLLFSTTEEKISTTMDGGEYASMSVGEILDFPDDSSHINLIEAKLINYFKPKYNKEFIKDYIPRISHNSYRDYYEKKFNSMIINLSNFGLCSFYTDVIEDFNTYMNMIDYPIIGENNFFESILKPYIDQTTGKEK